MNDINALFCGCGFLASHILPHILPHAKHIVLVDRERVEKANYDNAILPKNYENRRKVMALASLSQLLSPIQVTPIHDNIRDDNQLIEICNLHSINFIFVTFDNIQARLLAQLAAIGLEIPAIFAGVTEGLAYIDWATYINLPKSPEEIARIEEELAQIRDVCTRIEFRPLGAACAGYSYQSFVRWITHGEKWMYQISVRDKIESTSLRRL